MQATKLIKLAGLFLLLVCVSQTHAQSDLQFRKYRVDKPQKALIGSTRNSITAPVSDSGSEYRLPPSGDTGDGSSYTCYISGITSAKYNASYNYFLSCSPAMQADYWEVSCGTVTSWSGTSISMLWNTTPCASSIIRARSFDGTILASITVNISMPVLSGGLISNASQTVSYGATPASISATAASGGTCTAYTYQWQRSSDAINYTDIPGATAQNYQPGVITATTYFRRKVTCDAATAYTSNYATVAMSAQPLSGGCLTSESQTVLYGNLPATVTASVASGGMCGVYQYQWQSSLDNIYFIDMPGAIYQNLGFINPLSVTTYFQRKTTCGSEVKYTGWVKVDMVSSLPTLFYNDSLTATFTKNNCAAGGIGSLVTYKVAANTYSSTISKLDANQKAQNDINVNGQSYANNMGFCTWKNDAIAGYYYSQNCKYDYISQPYYVSVAANLFSSTLSKIDANTQAQVYAQNQANLYGTCQYNPPCSISNCSGESERCINGTCTNGYKVYTDTYYDYWTGDWICIYHYEWPDGFWSDNYQEYNGGPCPL